MRPLTFKTPKCLIPIAGVPLLEIWYRLLEKQGVTEALINTHHLADQVREFIRSLQTSIHTELTYEPELLGSAGTIRRNRDFVRGEKDFWIIYADSVTTMPLENLLRFHREKESILTMGLFHTDVPKESGIVTLDESGRIVGFVEKSLDPPGDLSNTGIFAASPSFLNEIPDQYPSDLSYHVLPKLVNRMYGKVLDGFFIDIGTMINYRIAGKEWMKYITVTDVKKD